MIGMGALTEQLPRAGQGARTFGLETGRSYLAVARFATARGPPPCPKWLEPVGGTTGSTSHHARSQPRHRKDHTCN